MVQCDRWRFGLRGHWFGLVLICIGCSQAFDPSAVDSEEKLIAQSQTEFLAPTQLLKRLKAEATELELAPLTFLLIEEVGRPFGGGKPIRIQTGPGGGELDLDSLFSRSERVPSAGAYRLYFDLPELRDKSSDLSVWFICNAKPRELARGEKVGCQCGAAYNLTESFRKIHQTSKGLLLALALDRDLGAIGGTFFFSFAREGGRRGLARLTFTDKSRTQAFCRNAP